MAAAFSVADPASAEYAPAEVPEALRAMLHDVMNSDLPLTDEDRADIRMILGEDADAGDAEDTADADDPTDVGDADELKPPATAGKRSRAEQSRINGSKSRGPTSMTGKQIAAMNSIVHGMRSRPGMLPDENCEAFDVHVAGVIDELSPTTALQHRLARRVAELSWRLQRVPTIETQLLLRMSIDDGRPLAGSRGVDELLSRGIGTDKDAGLLRIQRYTTTMERSMRNCLRELRDLQGASARVAMSATFGSATLHAHATAGGIRRPEPVPDVPTSIDVRASDAPATVAEKRPATPVPSDGLRFSGSFGALATMAMPVTAISAEAAVAAISGSLGKMRRPAANTRPPIPMTNEILPHLGQNGAIGAV